MKIAKRAILMLCVFPMLFSMLITVYASYAIKLTAGSITVEKGTGTEMVDIPITISNNTGIIGMTLTIDYSEGLTLTGVNKGDAFTSLTMTKPGDFSANPVKVTWDGEDKNDYGNGTAVILSFMVPRNTEKEYLIEISVSGVIDENINPVAISTENGEIIVNNNSSFEDTILDSGVDSNGIQWTLYKTGILNISGDGAMADYSKTSEIPWYSNRLSITEVIIEENVTDIADRAFYGCINATKVSIPETVTSIGTYAFRNCDEMTIYGAKGSYAETYAKENDIPFVNTKAEELKEITVDYAATTKNMYFDVTIEDYEDVAIVYVALYDSNHRMISATSENLVLDDITSLSLKTNENAEYAKVFVWKDGLKPVTKVEKISEL